MGEYGHLTANGWYLTVVYGTNENGKYEVMERRKEPAGNSGMFLKSKFLY